MRVVLVSQVPPAVHGLTALLQGLGHEPVALLCSREGAERYGELLEHVRNLPASLDVVPQPTDGRAMECADGTLWIMETEAA